MAYSKFTARALTKKFGVKFTAANLFEKVKLIEPSDWLLLTLEKNQKLGFSSKKSRSERLVSPILTELNDINHNNFTIYSGEILNADEKQELTGVPIAIGLASRR